MTNRLYDFGRQHFLDGSISWTNDTIKCVFVHTASYPVNFVTDENVSNIPVIARIAVSPAFTGKTATAGVADANDLFVSGFGGASVEAIVIYKDTGLDSTSRLIAYIDSASCLPFQPNFGDVTVQWSDGVNKIFKL